MKTVKNHLSVIAFAIISVVAIYNSHTALMLAGETGNAYIAAVSSETYKPLFQAYTSTPPAAF
jgi:hypothetical protein